MFGKWKYTDFAAMMEEKARRHARGHYRRPKYNVPVNIIENETEFELHVFALTYPKENIKVSVVNDMLYVTGTRNPEDLSPNFMLQEYPIKSFERSFELSHRADKSNIKVVRQGEGRAEVYYINLLEEDFVDSPYYYMNQGDIIIIPPLKQRPYQVYFGKNLALVISSVSLLILVLNLIK